MKSFIPQVMIRGRDVVHHSILEPDLFRIEAGASIEAGILYLSTAIMAYA
jgi:hypothetical protein